MSFSGSVRDHLETMHSILLPLLSLLSFVVYVQCESETYFILPATYDDTDKDENNPRYKIGDNIKVRWITDYDKTSVRVVQNFPNDTSWSYRFESMCRLMSCFPDLAHLRLFSQCHG